MKDNLIETLLTWCDSLLDFFTLGWWSRRQGAERIALHRERGQQ